MYFNPCIFLLFAFCSGTENFDLQGMQRQYKCREGIEMIEMSNFEGLPVVKSSMAEVQVQPYEKNKWVSLETDEFKVAQGKRGELKEEKFKTEMILNYVPIKEINCLFRAKMLRETINDANKYEQIITQNKKHNQINLNVLKDRQGAIVHLKRKMARGVAIFLATIVSLGILKFLCPLGFGLEMLAGLISWEIIQFHQFAIFLTMATVLPQIFLLTAGYKSFMQKMVSSDEVFWKNIERRVGYSYRLTLIVAMVTFCNFTVWALLSILNSMPYEHFEKTAIHHKIIPGPATAIHHKTIPGSIDWAEVFSMMQNYGEVNIFSPGSGESESYHRVLVVLAALLSSTFFSFFGIVLYGCSSLYYFIRFLPFFLLFFSIFRRTFSFAKRKIE